MDKICCIFNYAPHYRESIFQKMDKELKCDFYFGNTVFTPIKKLDYSLIKGYKGEFITLRIRSLKWMIGISKTLFRSYDSFIITGDPSYISNWLLLIYCLICQKKLYLWCHGLKSEHSRLGKLNFKFFYKNATGGLLLYGNHSRDLMIKMGFPQSKIHVIYNSLNYSDQYRIRQTLSKSNIYQKHFKNDDLVILFIGRLQIGKKLELVIEAQRLLANQGILVNVIFIGEGDMQLVLQKMAIDNNLSDRIWFFGSCYSEQRIAELIYNAFLTVSPGNVGLTAIHSMVYGTPVITHNNSNSQMPEFETIDTVYTGDLFEENNVYDLKDKICLWINRCYPKREIIRESCYRVIDSYYNPEYQIGILNEIFK